MKILIIIFFSASQLYSQYCIPSVGQNFGHGITNFNINSNPAVNRSSSPNEGYVNTGLTAALKKDSTYTVTIDFSYGVFCNAANIRIWIDLNIDNDFFDAGEMVIDVLNYTGSTQTIRTFTIPSSATSGLTKMRVTEKMTVGCGHTLPDPCNDPPDPLGYHGEYEDYDVVLTVITSIIKIGNELPEKFKLYQNYPNPFNPKTVISFQLAVNSFTKLVIYDILGREVSTLVNEQLQPGTYEVEWDGSNYPSGVYYYSLSSGNFTETKKMILIK